MRSLSKFTRHDKACIVFACLLLVLGISNFAVSGVQSTISWSYVRLIVVPIHYCFSAWLLLNGVIGLSAGITGIRALYIALTIIAIFGILVSLGGMIAAGFSGAFGLFNGKLSESSEANFNFKSEVFTLSIGYIALDVAAFISLSILSIISFCVAFYGRSPNTKSVEPMTKVIKHPQIAPCDSSSSLSVGQQATETEKIKALL